MTYREAHYNPLVRASTLLTPVVVARADNQHQGRMALIAAVAFAMSGMTLAFIMLMGLGYQNLSPRVSETDQSQDPRLIPYGQLGGPEIVEAVPMRDEEGKLLAPPRP
jgi:hypothetical protein